MSFSGWGKVFLSLLKLAGGEKANYNGSMELRAELLPQQVQKLILIPQLQQAMHILQLPIMELRELLEQELQENPFLEIVQEERVERKDEAKDPLLEEALSLDENWKEYFQAVQNLKEEEEEKGDIIEQYPSRPPSLQDVLLRQLRMSELSEGEKEIGEVLIANIDENGYLQVDLNEIARILNVPLEKVEKVLRVIHQFEPPGVGARNLKECLLLQLGRKKDVPPLVSHLVKNHLEDLAKKKFSSLAQKLGVSEEEIREAFKWIASLEPKPGREYWSVKTNFIVPDIIVKKVKDGYQVILNQDELPPLRINPLYRKILMEGKKKKEYKFLVEKLRNAVWLLKNLQGRQALVRKVAEYIVKNQEEFLEKGPEYLKPLTLKEVADALGVHISTVSRITSRKYMQTPRGIFPLKYFFSGAAPGKEGLSSTSVKEEIKKLIEEEDPAHPLSDQKIADLLKEKGIPIARRTVTKYREEMGILPARMRRA